MVQKWDDGDPDVEPTSRCFNAAINAYAKSGEPDAAHQAESLFEQMIEVFEAGNDEMQT
jgi:pentatricopeptide repeat protein